MPTIRVLLADDHGLLRKGVRSVLAQDGGISVVGEANDGAEAVRLSEELSPDVVLLDIAMPGLNGLDAAAHITKKSRRVGVIVLSMSNFYLYRFRDGRPTQLLPWDEDHAFWQADMAIDDRLDTNVLTAKVMQEPALRRLYLDTLVSASQTIAQTVPGDDRGWLEREADRLETKIAAAAAADPVSPFTFDEFTSNISGLRGLLRVRPPFVVCQAGAAIDPEAPQSCPAPDPIEISAPLPR